jgi:hypothetical protein
VIRVTVPFRQSGYTGFGIVTDYDVRTFTISNVSQHKLAVSELFRVNTDR